MSRYKYNKVFKLKIQKPRNFKNDFLSGLTVALALVPEAIAFSFVTHVDPSVGLYAAFIMGLVTAIIGGRPGMISGATGSIAIIFAGLVVQQQQLGNTSEQTLGYLFAAVILMGLFQIIFGLLKLGKFIRLVPHSVMLGFVNGLAIIIFMSQFELFYTGGREYGHLISGLQLVIMCTLIAATMAISYFLPKLTTAVPATLAAIITISIISFLLNKFGVVEVKTILDYVREMEPSKLTLAAALPSFSLPDIPYSFKTLLTILPYSVAAAAVGLIESLMTLCLVDELTETRGRGNRESIGQGIANFVNGFFGGMGGCAMIGQSMINIRAGGRGRTSGITAALCLLVFIVLAAPLIEMIPVAALIGVMFMVVIGTFEWSSFRVLSNIPKTDALVIIVVSVTTVVTGNLAIAVISGIILSALSFAWKQGIIIHSTTSLDERRAKVYELSGSLFFGSTTSFKKLFNFTGDPEQVIIDFKHTRIYDHSGLAALQYVTDKYNQVGKKIYLKNLSIESKNLLEKAKNIVEITTIEDMDWHLADDRLA
ncbi:MAG: SulP family inorganic anion transporter [bacterium]|nr:SulP family inorganic anion transporter [bacterium]